MEKIRFAVADTGWRSLFYVRIAKWLPEWFELTGVLCRTKERTEAYAKENGVILLLKGTATIVTDGEECRIVNRGCAGMATAGSGDVLSGVLAGLAGYNSGSAAMVSCGAYLAGLAGEMAEAEMGQIGMIASDTVRCLAKAAKQMQEKTGE